MKKYTSIAFKLTFYILLSCSVLFLGIFWYNYLFSKKIITQKIEDDAKHLTYATVNAIDSVLLRIEKIPKGVASFLENDPFDKDEILHMIYGAVRDNPEIYSMTVAFEPYAFDKDLLYFAPYCSRKKEKLELEYQGSASYRYFNLDWYQIPKELEVPVWSEPYFDEILMATYSVPFYTNVDGARKLTGVVSVDVSLRWLQEIISSLRIEKSGYGFLVSKNGVFVTHPQNDLIMDESIFSKADEADDKDLRVIGTNMVRGKTGLVSRTSLFGSKNSWLSYAPLSSSGWSLGIVFPQSELLFDINRLSRMVLVLGILGFIFLFAILFFIAISITRPIKILAATTRDIGKGKLDFDLSAIKSRDEVGMLAESFVYMRDSLKKYIRELTETTAASERMQSELQIAHDIQQGIIPKTFPPFPDRPEADLYAILEPAKEVGGDFYDFFFIDDERLCFVIGDVSGKGVPAAIFMAVTKTMIKAMVKKEDKPEEILSRLNKEVVQNNDSSMFVTIFCGILNIKTAEVSYSNAGHMFPLLVHSGGKVELLEGDTGIAVGASKEAEYKNSRMRLGPQDILLMYTDGITEAFNKNQELFGSARLRETISAASQKPIKDMVIEISCKVAEFCDGVPQSDDITLLALKYFGNERRREEPSVEKRIILKSKSFEMQKFKETVRAFTKACRVCDKATNEILLVLEEALVNIQAYAYADQNEHEIEVCLFATETEFTARLIDDGRPFDPSRMPEPDINATLKERKVGGLGIYFVNKFMDKIEHERKGDKNILTLKKRL